MLLEAILINLFPVDSYMQPRPHHHYLETGHPLISNCLQTFTIKWRHKVTKDTTNVLTATRFNHSRETCIVRYYGRRFLHGEHLCKAILPMSLSPVDKLQFNYNLTLSNQGWCETTPYPGVFFTYIQIYKFNGGWLHEVHCWNIYY